MKVGKIAKAIVGALGAGVGSLVVALGDNVIQDGEWVTIALAVIGSLGIVYVVPNAAQSEQRQRF